MTIGMIIGAVVLGWMVSATLSIPWIYGIGIVVLVGVLCQHGIGGAGRPVGSAVGGVVHGLGSALGWVKKIVLILAIFLPLMMFGAKLTGVSPAFATTSFQVLGPMPWNWPTGVGAPTLFFVAMVAILLFVANMAAGGRWKIVGCMYIGALVVFWLMMYIPALGRAIPSATYVDTYVGAVVDPRVASEGYIPDAIQNLPQNVLEAEAVVPRTWRRARRFLSGDPPPAVVVAPKTSTPTTAPGTPDYPARGEGKATQDEPVRAWLNPLKTYTRPSGPARYIFVEDKSLFFDDTEGYRVDRTPHRKVWWEMPEGKYDVYPLSAEEIFFRWYQ